MSDHAHLQSRIDEWGVEHFQARELTRLSQWGTRDLPPTDIWADIAPALRIADAARSALDEPVRVVSGWRPEAYNEEIGGSPTSEHTRFRALDLQPVDGDQMERFRSIVAGIVDHARRVGVDARVIHYDTFVHVDVGAKQWKSRTGLDNRSAA